MTNVTSIDGVYSSIAEAEKIASKADEILAMADRSRDAREWDEAREHYRRYLDSAPADAGIWVQYGHALKESGRLDEAERAYRQSIQLDAASSDSHLQLGHVLKLQGRRDACARAYVEALKLDPQSSHVRLELLGLGWSRAAIRRVASPFETAPVDDAVRSSHIAFDVSDLLHYFMDARLPTGIQRVQLNIISSLIERPRADFSLSVVCFSEKDDCWVDIPARLFERACALAVVSGDRTEPEWKLILDDLRSHIGSADACRFPHGAFLVNLGTSWWLQNYFLMVRQAKARYGIRYIPFVHDLIPVKAPEHCVRKLTRDFIGWLVGAFFHADGYLVNSQSTAADLVEVASLLGHRISAPKVVRLDGRFAETMEARFEPRGGASLVIGDGRGSTPYVLFVSTIESRKNHLLAFDAWLKMLKARGPRATPTLVCVGNRGWMIEAALARLESSDLLKSKVVLLSSVSDSELAELYRDCLFTIYPSAYEGWGLPVTESLCHGKTAVVAEISSLPEVGGSFVDYFDPASERDFREKLERMIDDVAFRKSLEERIASSFRPREWRMIGEDIVDELAALDRQRDATQDDEALAFDAAPGVLHRLSANTETSVWKGLTNGEMFRAGEGWNFADDWGCWMRAPSAELTFRIPRDSLAEKEDYFLFVSLRGLPSGTMDADFRITVVGAGSTTVGKLPHGVEAHKKLTFRLPPGKDVVRVRFASGASADLSEVTTGVDRRVATLGVASFYYGRANDVLARLKFMEAVAFSDLDSLLPQKNDTLEAADRRNS